MSQTTPADTQFNSPSFRIIGGGQTGADRAGLDTAIARNLLHGGWCPKGRKAEDGRIPDHYRLVETPTGSYLARTERNVIQAGASVIFTFDALSGGSKRTVDFAKKHRKPHLHLRLKPGHAEKSALELTAFLRSNRVTVLNVAGSRESKAPGIHAHTIEVLRLALDELALHPKTRQQVEAPFSTDEWAENAITKGNLYLSVQEFHALYPHRDVRYFEALNDPAVSEIAKGFLQRYVSSFTAESTVGDALICGPLLVSFYRQHGFRVRITWEDEGINVRVGRSGNYGEADSDRRCDFQYAFGYPDDAFDDLLVNAAVAMEPL